MSDPVIRDPHTAPADAPSTLVEFILARLDEDEQIALACGDREGGAVWTRQCWHRTADGEPEQPGHDECCMVDGDIRIYDEGGHDGDDAEHIARHDPARVLAEVTAKRAIVELHEPYASESHGGAACWVCGPGGFPWPCTTLRLLAMPYADHADYREDWKP